MALTRENGTLLSKTPGGTVLEAVTDPDPRVKVLVAVYKESPIDGSDYPTQRRQLWFRVGQVIRQSEWDREFPAPTIRTVSPATGPAAGGTVITITGTWFTTGTTVTVGGTAATAIDVDTDMKLKCTTPAKAAGAYDVVVTTAAGAATKTGGFTYS